MCEKTIRKYLKERGYGLILKTDAYGVKKYSVVDVNNLIISGEFTLSLEEVEEIYLKE